MRTADSAHRHGISDEDIRYALSNIMRVGTARVPDHIDRDDYDAVADWIESDDFEPEWRDPL